MYAAKRIRMIHRDILWFFDCDSADMFMPLREVSPADLTSRLVSC